MKTKLNNLLKCIGLIICSALMLITFQSFSKPNSFTDPKIVAEITAILKKPVVDNSSDKRTELYNYINKLSEAESKNLENEILQKTQLGKLFIAKLHESTVKSVLKRLKAQYNKEEISAIPKKSDKKSKIEKNKTLTVELGEVTYTPILNFENFKIEPKGISRQKKFRITFPDLQDVSEMEFFNFIFQSKNFPNYIQITKSADSFILEFLENESGILSRNLKVFDPRFVEKLIAAGLVLNDIEIRANEERDLFERRDQLVKDRNKIKKDPIKVN